MYQIHKGIIDSVHNISENNNRIIVNNILVYILSDTSHTKNDNS